MKSCEPCGTLGLIVTSHPNDERDGKIEDCPECDGMGYRRGVVMTGVDRILSFVDGRRKR